MKKKIIKVTSIGLIAIIIIFGLYHRTKANNTVKAEIYEVVRGEIVEYVEETGTIKSDSQRVIYSNAMGEVKNISVDEGDYVKSGDLLAEIDSEKIELEIKSLESQIEVLRATYREQIKPADKLEIDRAEARVQTVKIRVEEAKRNLENSKRLYEEGGISLNAYNNAEDKLAVEQNSLKIAENELKLLKKGASNNIKDQYEAQIADLIYKKEVLEKSREELTIKAPDDGIVTEIFIKEGTYLQPGMNVIEIGNTDNLYVEVDVLAREVGEIKENGLVIVYSDDLNIDEIDGRVEKIYPKAFSKISDLGIEQKRVRIDVNVPDNPKLRIGYEVDCKFKLEAKSNVLMVPDNTIFELEDNKYVFAVENSKALLREVETGLEGEDYIEIKSGLKEGDKVIISPDGDIEEGITVEE